MQYFFCPAESPTIQSPLFPDLFMMIMMRGACLYYILQEQNLGKMMLKNEALSAAQVKKES